MGSAGASFGKKWGGRALNIHNRKKMMDLIGLEFDGLENAGLETERPNGDISPAIVVFKFMPSFEQGLKYRV